MQLPRLSATAGKVKSDLKLSKKKEIYLLICTLFRNHIFYLSKDSS